MDDIRPPRGSMSPTPTGYGRTPGMNQQQAGQPVSTPPTSYPSAQTPEISHSTEDYSLNVSNKSSKKLKVLLIVSVIIAVAASAFAAWEYMQIRDLNDQISELEAENQRLNERVYSLNYDNRDLTLKLELLTSENESLQQLNKKLLETCGNACSTIIP